MTAAAAAPPPVDAGWTGLPPAWQLCWREAMAAWQHGGAPISAAVLGDDGEVLALGRNHIDDGHGSGAVRRHALAHAEVNALLSFDSDRRDPWAAGRQACAGDQATTLYDELAVLCVPLLDKDLV